MKLGKRVGIKEDVLVYQKDDTFVLADCRIGVEFEWEGTGDVARTRELPHTDWSYYWEWHRETSLRNSGSEFTFIEPLFGKDAIKALTGMCAFARQANWQSTLRTGIHVHIDVRDLDPQQLIGMCILYALYEKALYRWVGDSREDNHFCLPWYKAEGSVVQASEVIRQVNKQFDSGQEADVGLVHASENYGRYAGFNLASLFKFGSVEFRQLKTTYDLTRVVNWVNLCMSFKLGAYRAPTSDGAIVQMVEQLGPRAVGRNLLGHTFELLDYAALEDDVFNYGLPQAEELVREGLRTPQWSVKKLPRGENKSFKSFLRGPAGPFDLAPLVVAPTAEQNRRGLRVPAPGPDTVRGPDRPPEFRRRPERAEPARQDMERILNPRFVNVAIPPGMGDLFQAVAHPHNPFAQEVPLNEQPWTDFQAE